MNDSTTPMPHSVQAEKAVLSVLLQHPDLWDDRHDLSSDWFYAVTNRALYAAMEQQVMAGKSVELISLNQHLLDSGLSDLTGGISYLSDVYTYQPTDTHFAAHLAILREKLACRMVIAAGNDMVKRAYQAPDAAELLDCTSAPITAIHDTITGSRPALDAKALARVWFEEYEKLARGDKLPIGIETDIAEIDQALRGLQLGHMGVISARSSGGKSTLATQIMCGVASPETPALYLPLEGTIQAAYARCIIQLSRLPALAITSPIEYAEINGRQSITVAEKNKIGQTLKQMIAGGFHFDCPGNRKIQTVLSAIRRAHRKHRIKVAFVDYVQLIHGERSTSKEQEIMSISNALQELGAELGIFICVMSQENLDGDTKHAKAIEEDSDWTLSIRQNHDKKSDGYKEHIDILITKDRHNGKGGERLPLVLDRQYVRFITNNAKPAEIKRRSADF